ncbi:MAG TPA: FtsW/RodA/SpoVE family cell cycle protein [Defluviitoga sp.]|nr:FtsW/RodA/SpoVE family cell cycle protein [Defluviitoga sp.]HPZ74479.1 FtsW/RodA/SpoVE family cell cycle protein [Candidatus Pacearchaeota archaeon]
MGAFKIALFEEKKERMKSFEFYITICYICLLIIGYFSVKSAVLNSSLEGIEKQQLMWIIIGICGFFVAMFIPDRFIKMISPFLFYLTFLLLILVLLMPPVSGSRRWIRIGPIGFQPSEIFKIALIVYFSYILSEKNLKIFYFATFITLISAVLLYKEPDFSTAIIVLMTWFVLVFVSGKFEKLWQYSLGLALVGAPIIFLNMKEYQKGRILGFLFPEQYALTYFYNTEQAMKAIGSGGWFGRGYMNGYMNLSGLVPESQTDFILSVIGEEFGFIGISLLILLYAIIIWRLYVGYKNNDDLFWKYFYVGSAFLIFFHVFQNIGMNLGLLPVTGIPLPLVSYGGTSVLTFSLILGLAAKGLMFEKQITR